MKINEYNNFMKWYTRKKPSNKERADVLQWIDYNNGVHGTEAQHKEYKKQYATVANKYDESEDPRYIEPKEMDAIKKAIPVSPMVKEEEHFNDKILKRDKYEPKKKKIKRTLVVEKPKPEPKPPIINLLELEDWLNELDKNWWEEPEETYPWDEKVLLLAPRSKAEGITSILNLHKKFVG